MKLLSLLILQPGLFCTSWFLHYTAEIRRPLLYSLLSLTVVDILWIFNNLVLDVPSMFINTIGFPICYILLPLFFTKPSIRVRAISVQLLLATLPFLICMIMDFLLHRFADPLGLDLTPFYDPRTVSYMSLSIVLNLINCLAMFGTVKLLGRILSHVQEEKSLLWFLMIPLSQLILIIILTRLYFYKDDPVNAPMLTDLAVLLCAGSDIACLFGFHKYKKMQHANRQLAEVQHHLSLQTEHYRDLQDDILKVNKIRHDLKNQLQSAIYLMKQGNVQEADSQLDLLNLALSQKVGSRYSENLMADAVLSEKAKICERKNIHLLISAPIPQHLNIESAYLCSAFSNLLDNAIEGTLHSPNPAGPIDLSCDIQGSYLKIFCKNPSRIPKKEKNTELLRTHGLGLEILEEIARKYDGSFHTEWNNGFFNSYLILKM